LLKPEQQSDASIFFFDEKIKLPIFLKSNRYFQLCPYLNFSCCNVKVYVYVSVMVNNITELTQELSFTCHQLNSKKYYGTYTVQLSFTCA
jgi:hypothetical protein